SGSELRRLQALETRNSEPQTCPAAALLHLIGKPIPSSHVKQLGKYFGSSRNSEREIRNCRIEAPHENSNIRCSAARFAGFGCSTELRRQQGHGRAANHGAEPADPASAIAAID